MKKRHWLFAVGVVVTLAVAWLFMSRRPVRPLAEGAFHAAKAQWKQSRLVDYNLAVRVSGVQNGEYKISVRNNEVVAMTNAGEPVAERVWVFWTVDGMFRFIEEELSAQKQPAGVYGVADSNDVFLHAEFDKTLGYPMTFLRQVFGKNLTVEWRAELSRGANTH